MVKKDNNEEDMIDKLSGVGPATADKLRDAGYIDIMSIAVASPSELSDAAEIGDAVALKIIIFYNVIKFILHKLRCK